MKKMTMLTAMIMIVLVALMSNTVFAVDGVVEKRTGYVVPIGNLDTIQGSGYVNISVGENTDKDGNSQMIHEGGGAGQNNLDKGDEAS